MYPQPPAGNEPAQQKFRADEHRRYRSQLRDKQEIRASREQYAHRHDPEEHERQREAHKSGSAFYGAHREFKRPLRELLRLFARRGASRSGLLEHLVERVEYLLVAAGGFLLGKLRLAQNVVLRERAGHVRYARYSGRFRYVRSIRLRFL